jgi:hypothetical protein
MFEKPSLITRIALGKTIGLIFGIISFVLIPYFMPEVDSLFRWGILLWFITLGAFIGVFGVMTYHPVLKLPMPWWFRSSLIGGWMFFLIPFFSYDVLSEFMVSFFGEDGMFTSPFWITIDGAFSGLIIGYFVTRFGGEGAETVDR